VNADLERLAGAYGVATGYRDQSGAHRDVSEHTVAAVLRALGADPESPARSLEEHQLRDWRRALPPVFVAIAGRSLWSWVHLPHGSPLRAWVVLEDGSRRDLAQLDHVVAPRLVDGVLTGEAAIEIPSDLPLGWHEVYVHTSAGEHTMVLVVTPAYLASPRLGAERSWGLMTQIYATRSSSSWGLGDLADLSALATWSGCDLGADFVLINPMHAAEPVAPLTPSPYLPTSRRFTNEIYLHIESIPEYAQLDEQQCAYIASLAAPLQARNVTTDLLDRNAVWTAKRAALELLFTVPATTQRQAAFDAYVEREGVGLNDFATWSAIAEEHGIASATWPAELSHPSSAAVVEYAEQHLTRVNFHRWVQWLLDEQLTDVQAHAESVGMRIGVMHDLAVGVHPDSADAWALQDVLAQGVSVGAPPDMYNQLGQNWSQPPWRPEALADAAFMPYRNMLRTIMRHAGGLRIDHVLGLFRMWWIPDGMPAYEGTYVTFDHQAMLGILALEAHRADCVVIGEDLGTVEPWVQDALAERGILGTVILWFERDGGGLRTPEHWRRDVLASVTVHDLPPTAGYLALEHVRIRAELGLLTGDESAERLAAQREIDEWIDLATQRGLLGESPSTEDIVFALHQLLAQSPARLLGVSLPDLVGEVRAQNQPGTDQEYPNWRVPLAHRDGNPVLIEDIGRYPLVARVARALESHSID
jgi:4-alpha-glucanotransferase